MQTPQGNEMAKFRTNMKKLMKEKKISRMELVREEGLSYPTVMKWENEAMQSLDADLVNRLMHRLGVPIQDLIYITEE